MLAPHNKRRRRCKVLESKPEKNRAKFECGNCEYVWWGRLIKKNPIGEEPSEFTIRFFTKYWADGVNMICPKCSKVEKKLWGDKMSKRHNEIKQMKIEAIRLALTFVGLPTNDARKIVAHLEKLGYELVQTEKTKG